MGDRLKNAKTVVIMPVDVKMYKVTAGGVKELMDEWSDEAKDNILKSVKEEISNSYKFNLKAFPEISSLHT
ncbi:MAG: hypothetical protein HYY56_00865 [Candidatus Omnitrophica bacterium]|nr:hypothetical protein [Candidatus Omnitrophota bacterium]